MSSRGGLRGEVAAVSRELLSRIEALLIAEHNGRWRGAEIRFRCPSPSHADEHPSADYSPRKNVYICRSCGARGGILDLVRLLGIETPRVASSCRDASRALSCSDRRDWERTKRAIGIWRSCRRGSGTPVEFYLANRGLRLALPPALRFHPSLKHRHGGVWPAMVGLVTRGRDGEAVAIHRTFLSRDGSSKAPLQPQRMMLGPCRGGAVRLAEPSHTLMVGEGIETCLAAMQATGLPAWAALSTSGLRVLELPLEVRDVVVLADGDEPGEVAAVEVARRWVREGRRVRIARPAHGTDFNDMLMGRTVGGSA